MNMQLLNDILRDELDQLRGHITVSGVHGGRDGVTNRLPWR